MTVFIATGTIPYETVDTLGVHETRAGAEAQVREALTAKGSIYGWGRVTEWELGGDWVMEVTLEKNGTQECRTRAGG